MDSRATLPNLNPDSPTSAALPFAFLGLNYIAKKARRSRRALSIPTAPKSTYADGQNLSFESSVLRSLGLSPLSRPPPQCTAGWKEQRAWPSTPRGTRGVSLHLRTPKVPRRVEPIASRSQMGWPSPEVPSGDQSARCQWEEWSLVTCQNHAL